MASVIPAIFATSRDPSVREAMLVGSYMEGGWNSPFGVGDSGTSFGPFQIHLPAHPGVTRAEAEDPTWAANYMWSSYASSVTRVDPTLWVNDPAHAAAKTAYFAERPAHMYPEDRIQSAWRATAQIMQSQGQDLGVSRCQAIVDSYNANPTGAGQWQLALASWVLGGCGSTSDLSAAVARGATQGSGSASDPLSGGTGIPNAVAGAGKGVASTVCDVECAACDKLPGPDALKAVNPVCAPCFACRGDLPGLGFISSVPDALKFLFSIRFLEIIGGGLLVLLGISLLGRQLGAPVPSPAAIATAVK